MLLFIAVPSFATESFSFRTGILPILTKAGCNSGACHGAATGQGGFKLSLLGYDPEEDHLRITRELGGRRVDLFAPKESLLLRKPARELEHEGGRRMPRGSEAYATLVSWIRAGAPYGPGDLKVETIRVEPDETLAEKADETVQLRVRARLSDGSEQDVTALALYTSNDDAVAEVSREGLVTTRGRGLTSIMIRYSGQVAAARVAVPFSPDALPREFPVFNFVDEHIGAELRRLRLPASPLSDDGEFLRRVYLDVTGRLPSAEQARAFLAEQGTRARRAQVIQELLQSDAFVDFWTMRFADLLLISGKRGSEAAARAYHEWVREQIARNTPFDQFARSMLTASGSIAENGPANFFMLATDPRDLAEHAGRIFLGSQIGCARCHAHPSDRWTQDDYHRFAAYFARLSRDGGMIQVSDRGEVDHPKTGRPVAPKPLGSTGGGISGGDRRIELAAWMTGPENALFARTLVNRVWKHLMGRGLVEPVDDLRPTNPATNPALLEALAADFVANGFDLRRLMRTILESRTYQLSSRTTGGNSSDTRFHSHALVKELPAQVFVDAVGQVTERAERFEGYPEGTRAVALIGSATPSVALDILGRCARERSCEVSGRTGGGLAQSLHLINGSTINGKLRDGILKRLLQSSVTDRDLIDELYLRALTRLPSAAERDEWERHMRESGNRTEAAEDFLWTLLNSREFAFNH